MNARAILAMKTLTVTTPLETLFVLVTLVTLETEQNALVRTVVM